MKNHLSLPQVFLILFAVGYLFNSQLIASNNANVESYESTNIIVTKNYKSTNNTVIEFKEKKMTDKSTSKTESSETIYIDVKGMVCSFCAQGIKKSFENHDSVNEVIVDLENKSVKLSLKSSKVISDEEIQLIINDAGYNINKIIRE